MEASLPTRWVVLLLSFFLLNYKRFSLSEQTPERFRISYVSSTVGKYRCSSDKLFNLWNVQKLEHSTINAFATHFSWPGQQKSLFCRLFQFIQILSDTHHSRLQPPIHVSDTIRNCRLARGFVFQNILLLTCTVYGFKSHSAQQMLITAQLSSVYFPVGARICCKS